MMRPELTKDISLIDFTQFYWLKSELINFCRIQGINSSDGKIAITNRIIKFLKTGEKSIPERSKNSSSFDWGKAHLTLDTVITDNYRNTYNVRNFMQKHIGPHFKVNVEFIAWTKQNIGKSLKDAIIEWQRIIQTKVTTTTNIAPQFEYNTYIRDFLADNPDKAFQQAIQAWKLKRQQPGNRKYSKADLLLLDN